MSPPFRRQDTLCLADCSVLVVDDVPESLNVLCSVVKGFGFGRLVRSSSAKQAQAALVREPVDLLLVDCAMPEMDGFDFVRWLRRDETTGARHAPVIMIAGHASASVVHKSRDCGANYVVCKPITPAILLERILWVSREKRAFVECDTYVGPDRRFRNAGIPAGIEGRRKGDLPAEVGAATEPNLDQSAIDQLFKPQKVAL